MHPIQLRERTIYLHSLIKKRRMLIKDAYTMGKSLKYLYVRVYQTYGNEYRNLFRRSSPIEKL